MNYKWKSFTDIKVNAQDVGDCLERLRTKNGGRLTPQSVLKEAKKKRSPLHGAFEWDDTLAAVKYRETQASYILRSVVIITENADAPPIRAFVSIVDDDERYYTSVQVALSDKELRQQILERAKKEALDFKKKYLELEEFAAVFDAIDDVAA